MSCFLRNNNDHVAWIKKEKSASCAIHYEAIKSDKLVTPQNYASWLTLFEAAKIKSFQPIDRQ